MPANELVFWDTQFLARRYRVKPQTILDWEKVGLLPPGERIGPKIVRWRSDRVEAHEAAREQATQAAAKAEAKAAARADRMHQRAK